MIYDRRGYFYSSLFQSEKIFACFGTRSIGDAKNPQTAESLLLQVGAHADRIVRPIQSHSITIANTDENTGDQPDVTDGLISTVPGTALSVITADCVPALFINKQSLQIGASHQGWRGLYGNMPRAMVTDMSKGGGADGIFVAIGPAIGACCYEVSRELYEQFAAAFSRLGGSYLQMRDNKYFLSLNTLCYLQLLEAGVPKGNIDFFPFCTKCNSNLFFSHRRDGVHDKSRLLSIIIAKKTNE